MKIIGATVGTSLPKPSFAQTDPKKGDYIKDKEVLDDRYYTEEEIDIKFSELISVDDIDAICGATIQVASLNNEVMF